MASIDDLINEVTKIPDAEDAALKALNGTIQNLEKKVADALAGTLPPAKQAALDAAFAAAKAANDKMAAAVVANTPVA